MTAEEWLALDSTIEKSRKSYAHFDLRTDLSKQRSYVSDPERIIHHGFYPFIHYKQRQVKFNGKKKKVKERDICYAAHIDRCIYQYYSFLLNELYNRRIARDGLAETAVAYRTDLHQNNIHFARRAFEFILGHSPCYVMIGDFTSFFDHLDHQYLKRQWCSLLGVSRLPEDHYKVFRSITRYSTWELSDLLMLNDLEDKESDRRKLNARARVLTPEEYKLYSTKKHIQKNPNPYGIPQGSPISGVLANLYMLEADKTVHDLVTSLGGFYMRYSDDFMVILPDTGEETSRALRRVSDIFNGIDGLTLAPEKTQYFRYDRQTLENIGEQFGIPMEGQKRAISFLGFTFDGRSVSIRTKTTGKYYYRMYKKAKTIRENNQNPLRKKHYSARNLYGLYSKEGVRGCWIRDKRGKLVWHQGNFLSYVQRSKRVFRGIGARDLIGRDTQRHMQKIQKALHKA